MACGYVYILINPIKLGYVKIGQTADSPEKRAKQLSTTGHPFPFVVAYEEQLTRYKEAEREVHLRLDQFRVNKEFFEIPLKRAIQVVSEVAEEYRRSGPSPLPEMRLVVCHGQRPYVWYRLNLGSNVIGRAGDDSVDIDLEDQEPPGRPLCSRQHACISLDADGLRIHDLESSNGTFANHVRIEPFQQHPLVANDIIWIGNVGMTVDVREIEQ